MGKWVLGLCVSLYAVLILFGGDGYDANDYADAIVVEANAPQPRIQIARSIDIPEVRLTPAVAAPAVPAEPEGDLVVVPPVSTASLDPELTKQIPARTDPVESAGEVPAIEATQPTEPVREIWTVTGNRVNLREGASTQNGVVGQTVRGDSAEIVEMLDNGWAKVYIIERGIEAYMSASFLTQDQG